MTLRKVPGALALGLLASLAAHASLYGGSHAMGGAYHELLAQVALASALALVLFFGAFAWNGSRGVTDGSIVSARLREWLPSSGALWSATGAWYLLAETIEPHHAGAPAIGVIAALTIAAWLILRIARSAAELIAGAVIAVLRTSFSGRTPCWKKRARTSPVVRRIPVVRRRFARPPPIAIACA